MGGGPSLVLCWQQFSFSLAEEVFCSSDGGDHNVLYEATHGHRQRHRSVKPTWPPFWLQEKDGATRLLANAIIDAL